MPDQNKVKFGLKNVHYAVATIAIDGSATFGTPKKIPGAVSLSFDPNGENTPFYADDVVYYNAPGAAGYNGDLEMAELTDDFRADILGEKVDDNGLKYEMAGAPVKNFALLFEFDGDKNATRHVLYNCTSSRPGIASQTKEDTTEPQTTSLTITAGTIHVADLESEGSGDLVKSRCLKGDTDYATFFNSVVIPSVAVTPPGPENTPAG